MRARGAPESAVAERELQETPDDPLIRLLAAQAYVLESGDSPSKLTAASEHVKKVLETDPKNVSALMLAGRISMLHGQPAIAQVSYQAAIAAAPDNAEAYLALGETWSRLGNEEQATAAYGQYRRLRGMSALSAMAKPTSPTPGQAPPKIIGPGTNAKIRPRS